jgi:succinyl-diaminopimelate desuccinylase
MREINQFILEDLRGLVRINSAQTAPEPGMPFGRGAREALTFFLDRARAFGLRTADCDGYAGHAEYGGDGGDGGKLIGVLVHLDVVPATARDWTYPPFEGRIADGKIYGRGVADDKGAVAVLLHVLKSLRDDGIKLKNRVRLIAGCNEENGSECVKYYFRREAMPDLAFSPDADFPLISAEKHLIRAEITLKTGGAFARVRSASGGAPVNIVPDCAEAVLSDGRTLRFTGRAAHSMECYKGDNAVWKLCAALRAEFPHAEDAALDFLNAGLCRDVYGRGLGIDCSDGFSGALTCNLVMLKYDGGGAVTVNLDIRCPVGAEPDDIVGGIRRRLPEGGVLSVSLIDRGYSVPIDAPLVRTLLSAYEKATGKAGEPKASGGGTYARRLKTGVAFGPMFPDCEYNIHAADENLPLDQIPPLFRIYREALISLGNL